MHDRYLAEISHRRRHSVAPWHAPCCATSIYRAGSSPSRSGTTSSQSSRWSMPSASPRSGPHSGGALNDYNFCNDALMCASRRPGRSTRASTRSSAQKWTSASGVLSSSAQMSVCSVLPTLWAPMRPTLFCMHRPLAGGRPLTGILQTITKLGGGQRSDWCW